MNRFYWRWALYTLSSLPLSSNATTTPEHPDIWLGLGLGVGGVQARYKASGDTSTSSPNATTKLELGYDLNSQFGFYGSYDFVWDKNQRDEHFHIGSTGVRGKWPLDEQWSIFAKAGLSLLVTGHNDNGPSGSIGVGGTYRLSDSVYLKAGFDYYDNLEFSSNKLLNISQTYLGLEYRFNQSKESGIHFINQEPTMNKETSKQPPKAKEVEHILSNTTLLFAPNASELVTTNALLPLAALIKKQPWKRVTIVGHTDNTGTKTYNLWLSEKRAKAVAHYLTTQGVDTSQITVLGKGALEPVAGNHSKEERSKNRRVEIILSTTLE